MLLPLKTEFYGRYSTENDANTTVYDTVSGRVTNHPGYLADAEFANLTTTDRSTLVRDQLTVIVF